jgi:hypothetical protein
MEENLGPIPEEFYCFETNSPFKECLVCGKDLTLGDTDYFVEKAIKNYPAHEVVDVVYEYAMCWHCAQRMNGQMSEDSMQQIQAYFAQQKDFMHKMMQYQSGQKNQLDENLQQCIITKEPVKSLSEYMIYGHFRGNKMVLNTMPYLLSGQVMDEITDLLSNETLGEIDDFMGNYFGGPPELEELWKTRRPVFF